MSKEKAIRSSLTGAWRREGKFGVFFSGSFTRQRLLEELDKYPGVEEFQLYVSPVSEKEKETSPDMLITFSEKLAKKA